VLKALATLTVDIFDMMSGPYAGFLKGGFDNFFAWLIAANAL